MRRLAVALLALAIAACHKQTESLVVVTAIPADASISGLDTLIISVGMTSQTYAINVPPTGVSVGLYLPESVTGRLTAYATATHAGNACGPGYFGMGSVTVSKAGDTAGVMITMAAQSSLCPPTSDAGTGGTGVDAGSGGNDGGGADAGDGGGTGGTGGSRPPGPPDLSRCTEIDHGNQGTCGTCTPGTVADVMVWGVAFSPTDPSLVVTGGSDGRVRVWTNANGALTATTTVLAGSAPAVVAFSRDGSTLAIGRTGGVDIVNVADWTVARTLVTSPGVSAFGVGFSPDGADVFTVVIPPNAPNGGALFVHAVANVQPMVVQAVAKAYWLAVEPVALSGQEQVAVTDGNGKASIYSWSPTAQMLTGPVSLSVTIDSSTAEAAAFAPNGLVLAAGGDDGFVSLWNYPFTNNHAPDGQINVYAYTHSNVVRAIAFTPNYGWVAVGGGAPGSLTAYTLGGGSQVGQQFSPHDDVVSLAFSPNSNMVVAGEGNCGCVVVCPQ